MSKTQLILTIDLGTGGPKAALFSPQGQLLGHAFAETPIHLLPGGGAEQDPADWWNAIKSAIKQLLSQVKIDPTDILALNVTAQWSGTVAVDKEGNPLMNSIIWMDSRGVKQIQKIVKGFPMVEGYAAGKILTWLKKTGGAPGQSGKDPLAHILWIRENKPDIYHKTYKFLEPKDYLNLKLTGKFAASFDSITLHWATDNRKINDIKYDDELLKLSTLDRAKLPDLNPPNQILGTLTQKTADELGLSPDTKVISGTPDLQSAAVGSGAVLDFQPHLYVGTSSWLICHVPWKKTDIAHNMAALPAAIPGKYFIVNEQETAGECLDFLRDKILYPKDALSEQEAPADFFQRINELAAAIKPGSEGLIFMPWLYGERSPIEDSHVRGGFFNMGLNSSRAHMVRAIMEGVACNSRWLLMNVEKMCKQQFEAINFIGGGAQSEVWCQIFADVFDRPIRQVKDPILANARGAAFLASMALGLITAEEIPAKIEIQKTFSPNPKNKKVYDKLFKEFIGLYKRNKKAFKRLNS